MVLACFADTSDVVRIIRLSQERTSGMNYPASTTVTSSL